MGLTTMLLYLRLCFHLSLIQMSGAEHHGGRNIAQMVPISTQQLSMPGQALQGIRWPMYHPQTGTPVKF